MFSTRNIMAKIETFKAVRTARDVNPDVARLGYKGWVNTTIRTLGYDLVIPWQRTEAAAVEARVVSGVWVVFCPDPDCANVQIADFGEPFFCVDCLNQAAGGLPTQVKFTNVKKVNRIFSQRKNPRTRNWLPAHRRGPRKGQPETVADLQEENYRLGFEKRPETRRKEIS